MKYVGFLKRHSKFISCAGENPEVLREEQNIPQNTENIATYLEKGTMLMAMLHWEHDVDGEAIGPAIILTDGTWIWPGYYAFYLKKYKITPPKALVEHINASAGKSLVLNREERLYADYCLALMLKIEVTKIKIPNELQKIIDIMPVTAECY